LPACDWQLIAGQKTARATASAVNKQRKENQMNNSSRKNQSASMSFVFALLVCGMALLLAACSKKAGNSIVGKWQVEGQNAIVEFKSDGTVVNNEGGRAQGGKYTFSDDTHMKMEITVPKEELPPGAAVPPSITVNCVVKINGDDLDMDITMNMPGMPADAQAHTEKTRMKRIK